MSIKGRSDIWNPDFALESPKFAALRCLPFCLDGWTHWPSLAEYNRLVAACGVLTGSGVPVRFVQATPKPRGRARKGRSEGLPYEHMIWQKGEVSTRIESWHDFFNVLAWCLFPKIKAALNRRQAHLFVGSRNAEQNLLCMVDEGGVFAVHGAHGDLCGSVYFGHALHEAIMRQERGSEGLVVRLVIPEWAGISREGLAQVDAAVSELIIMQRLERDPPPFQKSGRSSTPVF